MADAGRSRILAAAAIAGLLGLQRLVGTHAVGDARVRLGFGLSLALCAGVMALGSPTGGRRLIKPARAYALLTLILLLSAFSRESARLMALRPVAAPTLPLIALIGFWIAVLATVTRKGHSAAAMLVGLVGLTAGTRLMTIVAQPFDRLDGDMLAAIDRSLGELFAGRFPYVDHPPPMPYLPVMFLAYAPAKLLGLDLRWTNLVLDSATVGATFLLAQRLARRDQVADAAPRLNQLLLPCLMLYPVWVQHGTNTQYAPCLFVTALLGFAILFENPKAEALALGVAVGSNQMLAACAPVVFAYWLARVGARRAAGLAILSAAVFVIIVGPFLLWEPKRFVDVAFLSRARFDDALMAGRFTLSPLASKILPRADLVGPAMAIAAAAWVAFRRRRPEATVEAMAWGLCLALMFQPVSFAHYFLPAIALAAVVPSAPALSPRLQ